MTKDFVEGGQGCCKRKSIQARTVEDTETGSLATVTEQIASYGQGNVIVWWRDFETRTIK